MKRLHKDNYHLLNQHIQQVPFNKLFAQLVIEKTVPGEIFVDNDENPSSFYVVHPYGMSLLIGKHTNRVFNDELRDYALNNHKVRNRFEWMQVYPYEWDTILSEILGEKLVASTNNPENRECGIVELGTRVNFRFNSEKFLALEPDNLPCGAEIVSTNKDHFEKITGSVVPSKFWSNYNEFSNYGKGFTVLYNKHLASTAFSAYVRGNVFEIGIETDARFWGKGFAQSVCRALINYCLGNGFEPVWACRLENEASYVLAQKLGFEPCARLPYYRLSK